VRHDEAFEYLLGHLGREEFVKHDFSDCLGPRYSIPGLVACWVTTLHIANTANKSLYEIRCDNGGSTDETISDLATYGLPWGTTQIVSRSRSSIYIEFILLERAILLLQFLSISISWGQIPSGTGPCLRLQVRRMQYHKIITNTTFEH
jgi:hypothetical protein